MMEEALHGLCSTLEHRRSRGHRASNPQWHCLHVRRSHGIYKSCKTRNMVKGVNGRDHEQRRQEGRVED